MVTTRIFRVPYTAHVYGMSTAHVMYLLRAKCMHVTHGMHAAHAVLNAYSPGLPLRPARESNNGISRLYLAYISPISRRFCVDHTMEVTAGVGEWVWVGGR